MLRLVCLDLYAVVVAKQVSTGTFSPAKSFVAFMLASWLAGFLLDSLVC